MIYILAGTLTLFVLCTAAAVALPSYTVQICSGPAGATFAMKAEPFVLGKSLLRMNLTIEPSDGMTYTYIIKFADKNMTISNRKVVEQP